MEISNVVIKACKAQKSIFNCDDKIELVCEGKCDMEVGFNNVFLKKCEMEVENPTNDNFLSEFCLKVNDTDSNKLNVKLGKTTINFTFSFMADVKTLSDKLNDSFIMKFQLVAKKNDGNIVAKSSVIDITKNMIQIPDFTIEDVERLIICKNVPEVIYSDETCNNERVQIATIDNTLGIIENSKVSVVYGEITVDHYLEKKEDNEIYFDQGSYSYPQSDIKLRFTVVSGRHRQEIEKIIPYNVAEGFNHLEVVLRKSTNQGEEDVNINNNDTKDIPIIYAGKNGDITHTIVIKNLAKVSAEENNAVLIEEPAPTKGVHVKDIKVRVTTLEPDEISRIEPCEPSSRPEFLNALEKDDPDERILNQNPEEIPLVIELSKIQDVKIKDNSKCLNLLINVSFQYKEDRNDNDNEWKTFNFNLKTTVEGKRPGKWYSVDFGTSAVVAYSMQMDNNITLEQISLDEMKTSLISREYNDDKNKLQDLRQPEGLIASTLYLNPVGTEETEQYRKQKVWFSPTRGMVDHLNQLPCLKTMAGNKEIPKILLKDDDKKKVPTSIEDIMRRTYDQLCRYYLGGEDMQALVFTVPNTFTPMHTEMIRKVLLEKVPSLEKRYLEFISESDAVLCLYLNTRERILNGNDEYKSRLQYPNERVLVFDMGAGTLDLTYAECKFDNENKRVKSVEILGRMGVNKAGDYIDYLLGEIVVDLLKNKATNDQEKEKIRTNLESLLNLSGKNNNSFIGERRIFKDYLCNKVKTILNNSDDTPLPKVDETNGENCYKIGSLEYDLKSITIGDIKKHDKFTSYIKSCTTDVIHNFAKMYGNSGNINNPRLELTTLFVSGRTISIKAIRDSLMEALKQFCNDNGRKIMRLAHGNENDNDNIKSKIVVAEGALNHVLLNLYTDNFSIKKRGVYGYYGVIIKNNKMKWISMISHKDDSYNKEITVHCDNNSSIMLCHTYQLDPIADVSANNYDSTVILHKSTVEEKGEYTIVLNMDQDGSSLKYKMGANEIQLEPHDDYGNESLRKSLWPVIYNV